MAYQVLLREKSSQLTKLKLRPWSSLLLIKRPVNNIFGFATSLGLVELGPLPSKFLTETKEIGLVFLTKVLPNAK